jgi:hypothetical protein
MILGADSGFNRPRSWRALCPGLATLRHRSRTFLQHAQQALECDLIVSAGLGLHPFGARNDSRLGTFLVNASHGWYRIARYALGAQRRRKDRLPGDGRRAGRSVCTRTDQHRAKSLIGEVLRAAPRRKSSTVCCSSPQWCALFRRGKYGGRDRERVFTRQMGQYRPDCSYGQRCGTGPCCH